MQFLLARVLELSVLRLKDVSFSLHQVLIYRTAILLQVCQFWNTIESELAHEGPHIMSIGDMKIIVPQLYDNNKEAKKLRLERLLKGWKDIDKVLHYQGLLYLPKVIRSELISRHHENPLAGHFGIKKTWESIARKYYLLMLQKDVETYVKGCNVCLASKTVCHKPYGDLQLLSVSTHWWKDLLMNFITSLPISANWKANSYDSILVIVNLLTKMVYYEPIKITINAPGLTKVIINMVMCHYGVPESIVIDQDSLFTLKFWSFLCYFLGIKKKLSTTFQLQING